MGGNWNKRLGDLAGISGNFLVLFLPLTVIWMDPVMCVEMVHKVQSPGFD